MSGPVMRRFDAKVAIVTGAASGIGRSLALALAREGARVAVADLPGAASREVVAQIGAEGGAAIAVDVDIASAAQVNRMVAATVAAFGRLDCAFNNAGISAASRSAGSARQMTTEISEESWGRVMAVNLTGTWLCMKCEIEQMLKSGGGSIVNTSSRAGLVAFPGMAAYVASKHGVVGLTKAAALEYATANIRINAICPGYVATPMSVEAVRLRGAEPPSGVPINRRSTPEEIAESAMWLASDQSSYVTGAAIPVDGGYTAT